MSVKRILTGIRPTGALHLGHYVGALKRWVSLQDEDKYDCFFLIADVQALTTHVDKPAVIEEAVREVALDWVGVGLDPTRPNVHFVLQSSVPELTELTVYFSMLVRLKEVLRNPTIKSELAQLGADPTVGFIDYLGSQAADILGFTPPPQKGNKLLVPVGADQVPHLEFTNVVARRFNRRYGKVFLPCTAKVGDVGRLPGIDGKAKMSKSLNNAIQLKDSPEAVERLVKKMFTDKTKLRKDDPGHPEECPVYLYHQAFGDSKALDERAAKCRSGELGCVNCKKDLVEALNAFLDPIRARRKEAEKMPLGDYLREGTAEARKVVAVTMEAVRKAMHLDYPSVFASN